MGIARYELGMNATHTSGTRMFGSAKPGPSHFKLRQKHAIVLALRAAGPFDGGNMS